MNFTPDQQNELDSMRAFLAQLQAQREAAIQQHQMQQQAAQEAAHQQSLADITSNLNAQLGQGDVLGNIEQQIAQMQQRQWGQTPNGADFANRNDLGVIPVGPRAAPGKQRPKLQEVKVPDGMNLHGKRLGIQDSPEYQAWLAAGAQTPLALRGNADVAPNQGLSEAFLKRRDGKLAATRDENAQRKATAKTLITARAQSRGTPFERLPLPMAAQIINNGLGSADPATLALLDPSGLMSQSQVANQRNINEQGQLQLQHMQVIAKSLSEAGATPDQIMGLITGMGGGGQSPALTPEDKQVINAAGSAHAAIGALGGPANVSPQHAQLIEFLYPGELEAEMKGGQAPGGFGSWVQDNFVGPYVGGYRPPWLPQGPVSTWGPQGNVRPGG